MSGNAFELGKKKVAQLKEEGKSRKVQRGGGVVRTRFFFSFIRLRPRMRLRPWGVVKDIRILQTFDIACVWQSYTYTIVTIPYL